MITIINFLYYFSAFIIIMAMFGYPITLKLLGKLFINRKNNKDYNYKPTVTVMVVAHNEEK